MNRTITGDNKNVFELLKVMDNTVTIFVRVLSEEKWFGAWAPVEAISKREEENVYILLESEVCEDDEYEFYVPGTEVQVEAFVGENEEEF